MASKRQDVGTRRRGIERHVIIGTWVTAAFIKDLRKSQRGREYCERKENLLCVSTYTWH